MPRKNRTDEVEHPETQQGQVTEKTEAPAAEVQGADESEEASVVEDQSVEKHQTPAAEEVTAEAPAAKAPKPMPAVTIDDFIATLVIDSKARIKTPLMVEHWHQWHAEHDPQWSVTSRELLAAFKKLDVKTDEQMTYGAALPTDITADDFLESSLYFHDQAFMTHDELEAGFWSWWHAMNCPYEVSMPGVVSGLYKRGATPRGDEWQGVALRESLEESRRFPPCSTCHQAAWRRQGEYYTCHTCGATEITLNTEISKVVPLNDEHFYLYARTKRRVQVLAHIDKTITPIYGVDLRPGCRVKLTGRLKHAPIRGGDVEKFELEVSKIGSQI